MLSHDYWARRFDRDPHAVGRTFRLRERLYEIIGVAEERFTGTEPGTVIDIFLPAMMNPAVTRSDSTWHRTLAVVKPGVAAASIRARLDAVSGAFERERAKGFTNMSQQSIQNYLHKTVQLQPAPSGVSGMQDANRRALAALAVLVGLVLLIACANVANLMTAQAATRAREMALRVSIGAGRRRLLQLVLVESAVLAFLAAAVGGLFAWWSAPIVVGMINPPDDPARLFLPADWRVFGFALALTVAVTVLFGMAPALRASAVRPVSAIKGGDNPHSRCRLMHGLIAVQVAFCVLVLFVAGLFVATFYRLSHQPTGFSADRLLTLDTIAARAQPPVVWEQVAEHLRGIPGVQSVALASRALLGGGNWNNSISINGGPPSDDLAYFMTISPGWLGTMKIPLIDGRDFRPGDALPAAAIVSLTFARRFFPNENPVGKTFDETGDAGERHSFRIVGLVRDARYRGMRDLNPPVAYLPFAAADHATLVVRTSVSDPAALAPVLRTEVSRARSEFRVSNIRTQAEINRSLTVRERLLATLAMFFAAVALLLAGIGLYGVLDYSVLERRREIGIRMAIGATPAVIVRLVTADLLTLVPAGVLCGLALGIASARSIESLFYEVKAGDAGVLALPAVAIFTAALVAALPAVIRAVRIDPVAMLRAE